MIEAEDRPVEILLVEDNDGDVFLTQKAFQQSRMTANFSVATDGEVALKMLQREGKYGDTPIPDIILLDINLPKVDGKSVLREIREDDKLRRIPVIMLTSSDTSRDVDGSYDLQANSYIVKPIDLQQFYDVVAAIESFWFSAVVLPEK